MSNAHAYKHNNAKQPEERLLCYKGM